MGWIAGGIDNRLAKTGWFQHGREVDPDFTSMHYTLTNTVKLKPPGTMTVPRTKYRQKASPANVRVEQAPTLGGFHLFPLKPNPT